MTEQQEQVTADVVIVGGMFRPKRFAQTQSRAGSTLGSFHTDSALQVVQREVSSLADWPMRSLSSTSS